MDHQFIAAPARFADDTALHGVEHQRVAIIMDHADQEGAAHGEGAGAHGGTEIERRNRLLDALAGFRIDLGRLVENP